MPRSFEGLKAASEVAKQIITLSTGVITVTIAFFEKIQGSTKNPCVHDLIVGSWFAFVLTICAAIATLQGVTTSLDHLDQIENGEKLAPVAPAKLPSAYDGSVRWPAIIMIALFTIAVILTVLAGAAR
jgi:hypothetical protein